MQAVVACLAAILALGGCLDHLVGGAVQPEDYASSKTYKTWTVEVDYSSSAKPDGSLLDFVKGRLNSVVHKDAINFVLDEALATDGGRAWSNNDLVAFANAHQGRKTGGSEVVTHLLFLTGHSDADTKDGKVLGVTFDHDLVVIFSDSVAASCQPGVLPLLSSCSPADYFRSVVTHEFGHALGLVDNGAAMVSPHEDGSHKGHSNNQNSVMYWAVEASNGLPIFGGSPPPTDFDDNDRADVRAMW